MPGHVPRSLIAWFFLTPHERRGVRIAAELFRKPGFRERIQLLDANDRDVVARASTSLLEQIVVDLSTANDDALYPRRIERIDFRQHRAERLLGEILERAERLAKPEQALRRHDDQRFAAAPVHLPAHQVKHL